MAVETHIQNLAVGEAPPLPKEISGDGREIWDWAIKFSDHVQRLDKLRQLRAEAAKPKRCGECYWWMKSRDCPKEVNVNGRSRGPSMNGFICSKFRETNDSIERRDKALSEMSQLASQVSA